MNLKLIRNILTPKSAKGVLSVDGEFECYTLEDPPREEKIPGITGISAGTYEIVLNWSPKFKRIMPLLLGVRDFSGIRIHSGAVPEHTEGCILVGDSWTNDRLFDSRTAYGRLLAKLMKAEDRIFITIVEDF